MYNFSTIHSNETVLNKLALEKDYNKTGPVQISGIIGMFRKST